MNEVYEAPEAVVYSVDTQIVMGGSDQIDPIGPGTGGED